MADVPLQAQADRELTAEVGVAVVADLVQIGAQRAVERDRRVEVPLIGNTFMCDWNAVICSVATRVRSQTNAMWIRSAITRARSCSSL